MDQLNELELFELRGNLSVRRRILLDMLVDRKITREEYANLYQATGSRDTIMEDLSLIRSGDTLKENNPTARLMTVSTRIKSQST